MTDPRDTPPGSRAEGGGGPLPRTSQGPEPDGPPLASWPPPGLERLQGDVWWVADRLLLGGAILMLPLLATLTLSNDLWRTGIYGDAWWVLLVTSLAGLWISLVGYVGLVRLLLRWRTAVRRGYAAGTVALALTDRWGDTGFLVQGARAFSLVGTKVRQGLLTGRLLRGGLMVAAGLWLSAGFALGVFVAARGGLDPGGLAVWTLAPPALAGILTLLARGWEDRELRRARRRWFALGWAQELAQNDIEDWHGAVARHSMAVPLNPGERDAGGAGLSVAAAGVAGTGLLVLLLAVPLVAVSGIGPVMGLVATPRLDGTLERTAGTWALAPWLLPASETAGPSEAGDALYAAAGTRPDQDMELLRAPTRSHGEVFPEDEERTNPTGMEAGRWSRDLIPLAAELDPVAVAYLEELGRHPALEELAVLARARALDEMGALYRLPLPDDLMWYELPIPRYQRVRQAAYAQVGAAAADLARGRVEAAEDRLRLVVTAGHLMSREGVYLITSLVGHSVARTGADALAALYDATGRTGEATRIREAMSLAERSAAIGGAGRGAPTMTDMAELVADTTVARGMRWENVVVLTGLGPCLNLKRVVFGPLPEYEAWLDGVRESLVRHESEEELLRILVKGWEQEEGPTAVEALFTQAMGRGAGSCAALLRAAM